MFQDGPRMSYLLLLLRWELWCLPHLLLWFGSLALPISCVLSLGCIMVEVSHMEGSWSLEGFYWRIEWVSPCLLAILYFLATARWVAMLQHLFSYGFGLAYGSSDHKLKPINLRQKLVIVAFTLLIPGICQW